MSYGGGGRRICTAFEGREWTLAEDLYIDRHRGDRVEQTASTLGRTRASVLARLFAIDMSKNKKRGGYPWS